jgi:hypothetical protein
LADIMDNIRDQYLRITPTDVMLASTYYPILVDLAKHKQCVTYGDLVERAKVVYPHRNAVQNAIAVSTGRRLDVVRMFTEKRDLPDLTSLVINKTSSECGSGFTKHFDPVATREKVFAFDWSKVSQDFEVFVKHSEEVVKPRKKRKESEALEEMAAYYQQHRQTLPASIRQSREVLVARIMEGLSAEEAFHEASSREP